MADETPVRTDDAALVDESTVDQKPEIDWKAKAREWEKRAKANAEAAKKLAELEESQKTEQQKLLERAEAAERAAREANIKLLRTKVAAAKGLPPSLASRLQGETEEEILADAEDLLASLPVTQTGGSGRPVEALRSGALPAGDSNSHPDAWLRRLAGR